MTSSVSQPSSYVVVEPMTANVATVVGSLSDAPATMPDPNLCSADSCCLRRIGRLLPEQEGGHHCRYRRRAIASISTRAPRGRAATAIVVRAGGGPLVNDSP